MILMSHAHPLSLAGRTGRRSLGGAAGLALALAAPLHGTVEVNVTRVGFPTLRTGAVVRPGAWAPVIVDVALTGPQQAFDGTLRVAQFDGDGDRCYDRVDVHLRAETGGNQRVYLYVPMNLSRERGALSVEVIGPEGEAVEVLCQGELTYLAAASQELQTIADDDLLILSMSTGAIGRVQDLLGPENTAQFTRELHVGHMSPLDLPELWIGLEGVDYIVWDDARPDELTERQLAALLEWVRQGGTLLIAASRTASAVALSKPLNAVLPVDIGDVVPVEDLDLRYTLVGPVAPGEDATATFPYPVPVARCTLREGATSVAGDEVLGRGVLTRRRVARGQIIFSAITLRDLFTAPGGAAEFFRDLFCLLEQKDPTEVPVLAVSLFGNVISAVSFSRSASHYLLVAGLASIGYVALATFGSWGFLHRRGWTHHSWSVFALVALGASALAIASVQSLRGFGETLHQLSIVDADADEPYGHATVFLGLKTSSDKRLDLWLPSDRLLATEPGLTTCFLRPLPSPPDPGTALTSFADPEEYRLVPGSAVLDDVRVRATLKLLEGRWTGPMGGKLTGQVTVRNLRIIHGSHVVNNLGVDLRNCMLLQPIADLGEVQGDRSAQIYCYPIGTVPSDGTRIDLASRCFPPDDLREDSRIMLDSLLSEKQRAWSDKFRGILGGVGLGGAGDSGSALGEELSALLLLSTIGELSATSLSGMFDQWAGERTWSRDRLRSVDLRNQLRTDSVILIGFADAPGPARVFCREGDRGFRPLEPYPERSLAMYRIRIPAVVLDRQAETEADPVRRVKSVRENTTR